MLQVKKKKGNLKYSLKFEPIEFENMFQGL